MLFTRKGDGGKTSVFGCNQKMSKSSAISEALGVLDEINSFLGICKAKMEASDLKIGDSKVSEIIHNIQNDLFIIQAQVAGADKKITDEKIKWLERIVNDIEKELPKINTFLISGTNEISAYFYFARTIARTAERRVVSVSEEGAQKIDSETLSYLNRLSSLLYALARFSTIKSGQKETPPTY